MTAFGSDREHPRHREPLSHKDSGFDYFRSKELDAGWSPEYGFLNGFHGDITFYTLTDCQVAHNNLNDFRPLDVRVRVSSVTPPETITKSLRVEQRFPSKPTTAEEGVAIVESAMQGVPSIIVRDVDVQ